LATVFLENLSSDLDRANFFIVGSEVALREPTVREKLHKLQESYIEVLVKVINRGIEDGILRSVDARKVAILVKSLVDGIEGNIALGIEPEPLALVPVGLDLIMNGILAKSGN
ncbi:MAG: TetR family transcriptional regulator C-terminal domain-containing protein, partial [Myxococcales bacterium]|nr:TetR family transcriptional regulator C-terminal domain-containing protein [Myxococcales bacterium]